jgi:hypothetical protein
MLRKKADTMRLYILIFFMSQLSILGCGSGGGVDGATGANNEPVADPAQDFGTRPLIKHLPILVEPLDPDNHCDGARPSIACAGDVVFDVFHEIGFTEKVFIEFNGVLEDQGTIAQGGEVRLAHFTFGVPGGTDVYAMADGIVSAVEMNQGVSDFEARIAPDSTSGYQLVYDHFFPSSGLAMGDQVTAGDIIGTTNPLSKFEADVTLDHSTGLCPTDFFDPAVASQLKAKITLLMQEWETFKGDPNIYDEASMHNIGCVTPTHEI